MGLIWGSSPQGFPAAIASFAIAKNRNVAVSGRSVGSGANEQTRGIITIASFQGVGLPGGLRVHVCRDDHLPGLVWM